MSIIRKVSPIEWIIIVLSTAILTFGVWPGRALAVPAYNSACIQSYGNGSFLTSMNVYGATYVDQRVHDGSTYTGWISLGKIGVHTWRGNYNYPHNRNVQVQYAVGNSNGWAYGNVGWVNPYASTPPCG